MDSNLSFDLLLDRINDFNLNHGYFPKVRISKAFWEKYAHEVADLAKDGISINVVDNIRGKDSFLLEERSRETIQIDTLMDLKKQVDTWVKEGKANWPVRCMGLHSNIYIPIQLYAIVPGEAPMEGLEHFSDFIGAPEAEHILVLTGD